MANNIIEYRTITPTTIVPITPEIKYLTVTYLVNEGNLTIPIINNPAGIRSIIIDGGKKQIWKTPQSMTQTFTTPGEHTIQFILEDDTALTSGMFYYITSIIDIQLPKSITTIPEGSLSNTHIRSLIIPEGVTWNHNYLPDLEHLEVYGTLPSGALSENSKLKTVIIGKTGILQGGCLTGSKTLDKVYIDGQFTGGGNFNGTTYIKELIFGENFRGSNILGNFGGVTIDSVIVNTTQEVFDIYQVGCGAYPKRIEFHCKNVTNSGNGGSYSTSLEEVILGNEVQDIIYNGYYFLSNCINLHNVKIGNSLKKLGYFILSAASLPKLVIPSNIKKLERYTIQSLGWKNAFNLEIKGPITLEDYSILEVKLPVLNIPSGSIINDHFYSCQIIKLIIQDEPKNYIGGSCSIMEFRNINNVNIPNSPNSTTIQLYFDSSVNKIADYTFKNYTRLIHIDIPKTVKYIGKEAFYGCDYLQSAYIGAEEIGEEAFMYAFNNSNITSTLRIDSKKIGKRAFYYVYPPMAIDFSENLQEIGEEAFYGIKLENGKTALNIYNCKVIGRRAFYNAYNYNTYGGYYGLSINLNNVEEIGDQAFYAYSTNTDYGTFSLSYCNLENIKKIGEQAFYGAKIDELIIGKNIEYIGEKAFEYALTKKVSILGSVIIPRYCFANNTLLTTVVLSSQISKIEAYAFNYCTSLTTINVDNIKIIGQDAFYGTPFLNNIQKDPNGGIYIGKVLYSTRNNSLPSEFRIKEGTISISDNFDSYGSNRITSIYIPSSLEYIGTQVFKDEKPLTIEVSLDNKYFNSKNNCNAIIETATNTLKLGCANTVIPSDIEVIGSYAFYNRVPSTIIIPETLKVVEDYAFYVSSPKEKSVYVSSLKQWLTIDFASPSSTPIYNNSSYSPLYVNDELVTEVIVPESVTEISNAVFYGYPLNSLTLHDGVTKIGKDAFRNCGLTELVLPNNLKYIDERAFQNNQLSSIIIPESVETLERYAFSQNSRLTTAAINSDILVSKNYSSADSLAQKIPANNFILGNQVTTIGQYAFSYSNLQSIILSDNTTVINNYAFASSPNLSSIIIPASVVDISSNAFYSCNSLINITINSNTIASRTYNTTSNLKTTFSKGKSFTFGEGVTKLSNNIFYGDTVVTSITLPSSISTIGNYAFQNCSNLTSLTVQRTTPPTLGTNALQGTSANLVIYVPAESADTYKAASGWSTYASQIEAISTE